ncbi:hybrid sensor histidine kinase/response regulator [Mesoterricola sediminis]|uniref:histidine kinase n=1 Tax=Mesoterricola sediminis TaxID=2927980 RepID=A0AA48GUJ0_9BACT|nr:hybrid sensor histidine kinase/response regulator [Mesoterricola sediminis]BDU75895.1 hypothetical protein METESE_08530 [Mesoterricola sediminis]
MRRAAVLVLLACAALGAQELGAPFSRIYRPREYGGSAQAWAFAEDPRGLLFAGNTLGILEHDGATWRLIPTRLRTVARHVAADRHGRVWVGAKNEFGYLEPDGTGQTRFVGLEQLLDPRDRDFGDAWTVLPFEGGACFAARRHLFRYDGKTIRVIRGETNFTLGFKVRGRLYISQIGRGPAEILEDRLEQLPGWPDPKEQANFMVPWGAGQGILVGTSKSGLLLFDGHGFEPFPTEADPLLKRMVISTGILLPDGTLAIGGLYGGCVVLDRQGRILLHLDRRNGLPDESLNRLYADRQARLWAATNRGMARVEWPGPLTAFGEDQGLLGSLSCLKRWKGSLYAGTSQGLFRLVRTQVPQDPPGAVIDPKAKAFPELSFGGMWRFRPVEGPTGRVWRLVEDRGRLLACNAHGVYEVGLERARRVYEGGAERDTFDLVASRRTPGLWFAGTHAGLWMYRERGGTWRREGQVPGVTGEVRALVGLEDGTLWAGTNASGAFHVIPGEGREPLRVEAFGKAEGLPSPAHDFPHLLPSGVVFATHKGFYRFNAFSRRFEPDPRFAGTLPPGDWYPEVVVGGPDGRLWMHLYNDLTGERLTGAAVPGPDGRFRLEAGAWRRIGDATLAGALAEPDGTVWMGGADGLFRYDPKAERQPAEAAPPLVRKVSVQGGGLLFGGSGLWQGAFRIPYAHRNLRFEFAAPAAPPDGSLRYQVRLVGNARDWSAPTAETLRDYTNLWEGKYRFQVRTVTALGQVSEPAEAVFRILPPWYRSWWAYLAYAGLVAAGIRGLIRLSLWRSRQAKRILMRKVAERTDQLRRRTAQLEQAKTAAEAAALAKSEFLANMSHEIRTPLNAILGYSEILQDEVAEPRHREHLAAIASGGKALLGVIGDILDLSKIEAGRVEPEHRPTDVRALLEDVARAFTLRCREKRLRLEVEAGADLPSYLVLSPVHLRQILFNLVGNAVKFTEEGVIRVSLRELARQGDCLDLRIDVEDTGIGIPADQLEAIFEPFHQARGQDMVRYGGTGLGLAICRRLAALMGGNLTVASTEALGSTFTLRLFGLPIADEASVAGEPTGPFRGAFRPATLLLVDDVPSNRDLLKAFFEPGPFTFLEASDGGEALRTAASGRPDLILMDLRMPGMDGLEATRLLKADPALQAIPVILLTASTTVTDEAPIWASGVDGFLRKPVSRTRLAAEMARFLPLEAPPEARVDEQPAEASPGASTPELLAELEAELPEWTRLKDVFFIDRMAAFAVRIAAIGDRHGSPALQTWAGRVQDQARAYDMENLPTTFRRFADVVEDLRAALR